MSDDITPIAPTPAEIEVLKSSYARMKTERDTLASERETFKRERDALSTETTSLKQERQAIAAERDDLRNKYTAADAERTTFSNTLRERDVLEGLRAAFPNVEAPTLRGAFIGAVEAGKAERYPADPAKAVPALVEHIKAANPTLARAVPAAGGANPPPKVETPAVGTRSRPAVFSIGARTGG